MHRDGQRTEARLHARPHPCAAPAPPTAAPHAPGRSSGVRSAAPAAPPRVWRQVRVLGRSAPARAVPPPGRHRQARRRAACSSGSARPSAQAASHLVWPTWVGAGATARSCCRRKPSSSAPAICSWTAAAAPKSRAAVTGWSRVHAIPSRSPKACKIGRLSLNRLAARSPSPCSSSAIAWSHCVSRSPGDSRPGKSRHGRR